jgi:tRNA-dihydrouridine synthase
MDSIKEKTMFQILTSHRAFTVEMIKDIVNLGYPWLDINLGCPSNTVTKNGGGSSLLLNLSTLRSLMTTIRETFPGRLTAKVRTGFHNTSEFEDSIKLLNDVGVEMITVHGRTRDMMYKEPAVWADIERAVKVSQVPIIGNGDIWAADDINRMLKETGCHSVMVHLNLPGWPRISSMGISKKTHKSDQIRLKRFLKNIALNWKQRTSQSEDS